MGSKGGCAIINGGTVKATGGGLYSVGIGEAGASSGYEVIINNGIVTAIGGPAGSGIGGFTQAAGDSKVEIYGGKVTAMGFGGAGIGGGVAYNGSAVKISGGEVTSISYPIPINDEIYQGEGIGAGASTGGSLLPGTFTMNYSGAYIYAGMDTNGVEGVTEVQAGDFATWHTNCYVQITATPRQGPDPAAVKIVSAKSARTEGAWSGAAEVVYELSNLKADGRYALAFELTAAGQFGARTNEVEAVVDGIYTQELSRTEFFGIESQVQDPAAELTLKLIEKSKAAK